MFLLLPISSLCLCTIAICLYCKWCFSYWKKRNVYSPPTARFPFGHAPNPFTMCRHLGENIVDLYREMKQKQLKLGGFYWILKPCLLPIHPDTLKQILTKDFGNFSNRHLFYNEKHDPISGHLLSLNGDKWRSLRTKLTPTFTSGKMKMMFKFFLDCGQMLEETMDKNKTNSVEIKGVISCYSTDIIGSCAFGLDLNSLQEPDNCFRKHGQLALTVNKLRSLLFFFSNLYPDFSRLLGLTQVPKEVGAFFLDIVHEIVQQRETTKTVGRNDFLQLLINIKNSDTFTMSELAAQCFVFFLAGYETSATTIAFAMYEIACNDVIQQTIRQEIYDVLAKYNDQVTYEGIMEMKYMTQVVEETLRKYPPSYYVTRMCTKTCKLERMDIDKGTLVVIPIAALHRDPEYYPEPERFNPERFTEENKRQRHPYTYLPFGEGPRSCIGMRFGMLEIKVALTFLLRKFKFAPNKKMQIPLKMKHRAILLEVTDGIWLDYQRI